MPHAAAPPLCIRVPLSLHAAQHRRRALCGGAQRGADHHAVRRGGAAPGGAPRADLYTVGALSCIALGILFYELHDLGGSPLGLTLLLLNMAVASLERLLQRRLLAVEVVDVSKPGMMLLNNGIGFVLTAVVAAFVPGEYARLRAIFSENKDSRALYVCASALVAVGISSTGLWFQSHVSATTFMVAAARARGAHRRHFLADTAAAVLGAVASLVASFAYASQQRESSRARVPATAAEHAARHADRGRRARGGVRLPRAGRRRGV